MAGQVRRHGPSCRGVRPPRYRGRVGAGPVRGPARFADRRRRAGVHEIYGPAHRVLLVDAGAVGGAAADADRFTPARCSTGGPRAPSSATAWTSPRATTSGTRRCIDLTDGTQPTTPASSARKLAPSPSQRRSSRFDERSRSARPTRRSACRTPRRLALPARAEPSIGAQRRADESAADESLCGRVVNTSEPPSPETADGE